MSERGGATSVTMPSLGRRCGALVVAAMLLPLPAPLPAAAHECAACACGSDCRCGPSCPGCGAGPSDHAAAPALAAAGQVGPAGEACGCPVATLRPAPDSGASALPVDRGQRGAPPAAGPASLAPHRSPFHDADLARSRPRAPPWA